jgi:16S rRNA (uracil1498-N3)-methyltransferase
MTQPLRLFVDAPLAERDEVALTEAQAHYVTSVMRRTVGDPVLVFNGRDGEWLAALSAASKRGAGIRPERQTRPQRDEPGPWLAFALLKRDATDLVIRMATELGAAAILPVITARTNAARVNEQRLLAIAIEAAEQCERLTIPTVLAPRPLAAVLDAWPSDRELFAAVERADAPPLRPARAPAGLLIGPEGGFTQGELDAFARSPIVTPSSLGPRILRAETACLAGLALLQAPGCG